MGLFYWESEDNHLRILSYNLQNFSAVVSENGETYTVPAAMSGVHTLYNTLMAYTASKLAGISHDVLLRSIHQFEGVERRFEMYKQPNASVIVVDYAHTVDAIAHYLMTAKQQGAQRIIHIFGFRGNRDARKRSGILSITAELSDQYILTFDDLNSVPPNEIADSLQHLHETYGNEKRIIVADRTKAIKQVMENSQPGDWIVITGKGHEKYRQNYLLPTDSGCDTVRYIAKLK